MAEIKKYDIGLVGVWYGWNYGSVLTNYALYSYLKSLGLNTLMITKPGRKEKFNDIEFNPDFHSYAFALKHYGDDISKPRLFSEMSELNKFVDTFMTGSDQLWNYQIEKSGNGAYLLNFVDDSHKRIAYSTSFGHSKDFTPAEDFDRRKNLFEKFNAISVRESSGIDILKTYGVNATQVIDPVFLPDKKIYDELSVESGLEEKEPYLLAYILDPTPEKLKSIDIIAAKLKLKIKLVLDGNPSVYEKFKDSVGPNVVPMPSVEEWVYYYKNASFVITDSYHGTCFSLIFEKNFIAIGNKARGIARFETLFNVIGNKERLTVDPLAVAKSDLINKNIDYAYVNKKLNSVIVFSQNWLKSALFKTQSIQCKFDIMSLCTGCAACVNACPVDALRLEPDELGYYRSTIDIDKCINCGLCSQICPALKLPENKNSDKPELYEFITSDEDLLFKSSSGGVFSVLAKEAFKRNGCVVGTAWADDFSVKHIIIDNEEDMPKLRKSKYLQSYVGLTFREVKQRLENGRFVLFSGCPCQTAGLKAYLKKDYENLIIIDILCGNAPSAMFFKKYIEEDFDVDKSQLKSYEFRTKKQGWNSDCLTLTLTSGQKILRRGIAEDNYQRVYHSHVMCSQHCENCKYQNVPRFGDITIGDFWGISKRDNTIDPSKGISAVLLNNDKGKQFFENISEEYIGLKKRVPFEWLGGNGFAPKGSHNYASPQRNDFYKAIKTMTFSEAVDYARKPNHGVLVHRYGRESLPALNYDVKALHFSFDDAYWEESFSDGVTILKVKPGMAIVGHYATLPLNGCLKKDQKYVMSIKFKANTESNILNFHIKDSGSNAYQVIYTHKIGDTKNKWVEIQKEFIPKQRFFDQFMLGASQISGDNSNLSIAYVNILEVKNNI